MDDDFKHCWLKFRRHAKTILQWGDLAFARTLTRTPRRTCTHSHTPTHTSTQAPSHALIHARTSAPQQWPTFKRILLLQHWWFFFGLFPSNKFIFSQKFIFQKSSKKNPWMKKCLKAWSLLMKKMFWGFIGKFLLFLDLGISSITTFKETRIKLRLKG